jgi:hypothetical protein
MKATKVQLHKAHLTSHDHQSLQTKLYEELKRKTTSRRSIHKGGRVKVSVAREKKRVRDEKEKEDAIHRAEKKIKVLVNKAKKALNTRGVIARKQEQACKATIQDLEAKGKAVPNALRIPIRDPEKDPTLDE